MNDPRMLLLQWGQGFLFSVQFLQIIFCCYIFFLYTFLWWGVPLLNFEAVPGSRFRGSGILVPLLHHAQNNLVSNYDYHSVEDKLNELKSNGIIDDSH